MLWFFNLLSLAARQAQNAPERAQLHPTATTPRQAPKLSPSTPNSTLAAPSSLLILPPVSTLLSRARRRTDAKPLEAELGAGNSVLTGRRTWAIQAHDGVNRKEISVPITPARALPSAPSTAGGSCVPQDTAELEPDSPDKQSCIRTFPQSQSAPFLLSAH